MVNRDELARRIAYQRGYKIGDIKKVLEDLEDVIEDAVRNGEPVKLGKLLRINLQEVPEKRAWDGLNKKYFTRERKIVPKLKLMSKLSNIEIPVKEE